jgi:hypothetical protein
MRSGEFPRSLSPVPHGGQHGPPEIRSGEVQPVNAGARRTRLKSSTPVSRQTGRSQRPISIYQRRRFLIGAFEASSVTCRDAPHSPFRRYKRFSAIWSRCSRVQTNDVRPHASAGAAAHFLEFDALIVPSVRWPCLNLILFLDCLDVDAALRVQETLDINWPAWKEKHASGPASGPERQ